MTAGAGANQKFIRNQKIWGEWPLSLRIGAIAGGVVYKVLILAPFIKSYTAGTASSVALQRPFPLLPLLVDSQVARRERADLRPFLFQKEQLILSRANVTVYSWAKTERTCPLIRDILALSLLSKHRLSEGSGPPSAPMAWQR